MEIHWLLAVSVTILTRAPLGFLPDQAQLGRNRDPNWSGQVLLAMLFKE
jgi:hypothetical protein